MERHQIHGTIIEDFKRPDPKLLEGFRKHETAKIGDAMSRYGVVHYEIKPLDNDMRVVGPALTVLTQPGDALFVQAAIDIAQPGDVVVIDASGYKDVSVIGERLAYYFQRRGVAGIIVDGAVRDSIGLVELGMPCFARSSCIKIWGSNGPGAVNVPIQCGGVPMKPGDIVVGDRDGVVIVPQDDVKRVLALTDEHLENELARLKEVESGRTVTEVFGIAPRLEKWRSDN